MDPIDRIILAGYLKRYPRMGSLFVDVKETIAGHSYVVAVAAHEIARKMGEDPKMCVLEAIWHDFEEALTTDHYPVARKFVNVPDREKSDIVHNADVLEVILSAWEHNVPELNLWMENSKKRLRLDEAKTIVDQIIGCRNISYFHRLLRTEGITNAGRMIVLAGLLKRFPRTIWYAAGIKEPETVAEHAFRAALIGSMLAEEESEDPGKVVENIVLHHLPEAIVGDHHELALKHTKIDRNGVWKIIGLKRVELNTVERDAETLEFIATAVEYRSVGVNGLDRWIERAVDSLHTETARRWAEELKSSDNLVERYERILEDLHQDF